MNDAQAKLIAAAARQGQRLLILCESDHHIQGASRAVAAQLPEGRRFAFTGNILVGAGEIRFLSLMGPDGQRPTEFDQVICDFDTTPTRQAGAA